MFSKREVRRVAVVTGSARKWRGREIPETCRVGSRASRLKTRHTWFVKTTYREGGPTQPAKGLRCLQTEKEDARTLKEVQERGVQLPVWGIEHPQDRWRDRKKMEVVPPPIMGEDEGTGVQTITHQNAL